MSPSSARCIVGYEVMLCLCRVGGAGENLGKDLGCNSAEANQELTREALSHEPMVLGLQARVACLPLEVSQAQNPLHRWAGSEGTLTLLRTHVSKTLKPVSSVTVSFP